MSKLSDPRKREEAFKVYCRYRDMDLIAEQFGVTTQTVYNWRREDNWDGKLSDLSTRFQGIMAVMKRAESDLIIQDWFAELRLLEFLELQAGQAIAVDGLRPTSWKDALATLKFVMERKDKLFERAKKKPTVSDAETPSEETAEELSDEQRKSIEEMMRLVSHTPPDPTPVDSPTGLSATVPPVPAAEPEDI